MKPRPGRTEAVPDNRAGRLAGPGAVPVGRPWPAALLLATASCGLVDPDPPELVGCLPQFQEVEQVATTSLAGVGVANAALLVLIDGQTVCRLSFGGLGPATPVPTASAAKWLTAGAILAVVDRGELTLDTRTGSLFPRVQASASNIELGQLLSHTSGLLWFSRCMGRPSTTLQACAEQILEGDLQFDPGSGFFYSGPPFTVAGAMAERATGDSWSDLFHRLIAGPLGMSHTSYGESPNPALSEGDVVATVDDYGRFAQMVLDSGVWRGRRILSEQAIQAMRRSWSAGIPIVSSPRGELPYGLGVWLDEVDGTGQGTVLSSPGIGGFVPMVDYRRRMVFIFGTVDPTGTVWPAVSAILSAVRTATDSGP